MALTKVSRGLLSTGIVDNSTTTAITIDSSENVGIGTGSPIAKIDILGTNYVVTNSGQARGGIHIQPASGAGAGEFGGAISFSTGGSGSSAIAAVNTGGSDTDSNGLAFFTHPSGTGSADAVENMRITEAGHVGLGTNAPGSLLDLGLGTTGTNQISWHNDATTSYGNIFQMRSNAATVIGHGLKGSETVAGGFQASTSSTWGRSAIEQYYGDIKFYANAASATTYGDAYTPTERMRISSSGATTFNGDISAVGIQANQDASGTLGEIRLYNARTDAAARNWAIQTNFAVYGDFVIRKSNAKDGNPITAGTTPFALNASGHPFFANIRNSAGSYAAKITAGSAELTFDTSSARYKDNIRESTYGLSAAMQLQSRMFEYKEDDQRTDIGFIAEEVNEVIPELVVIDGEGRPDAVNYDRITSVLLKAIQELKEELNAATARITELENN